MSRAENIEAAKLEPLAVRPKEAARLIGVSLRKFAEMRVCGLLPPGFKLGGCLVYQVTDLKLWAAWGFPPLDKFIALKDGRE